MGRANSAISLRRYSPARSVEQKPDTFPAAKASAEIVRDLFPHLELRIGITGHRPPRLAAKHRATIEQDIVTIFSVIRAELIDIYQEHRGCFAQSVPGMVLVSPLAAGGDSLASEIALSGGDRLDACLPFSVQTYHEDFDGEQRDQFDRLLAAARRTLILPGEDESRDEAYRAVGLLTASQCDILLAIWDGEQAQGAGGTPEIVAEAVASALPVIVIDARSRTPPRLLWVIEHDGPHDVWTVETVPSHPVDCELPRLIRQMVVPPERTADLLEDLTSTGHSAWRRSVGFPTLLAITGARSFRQAFAQSTLEDSAAQLTFPKVRTESTGSPEEASRDREEAIAERKLASRFAAADVCANRFALRYRGGFITNFAMSAAAVGLALLGLLLPAFKMAFVIAELLTIIVIVVRTREANRLGWHRRWIDARHLAELLRLLPLAAALGDLSLLRQGGGKTIASHEWYARATAREIGMSHGVIDAARVTSVRDQALLLIGDQVRYHEANARRMNLMDHRLRLTGERLFMVTIVACVAWLFAKAVGAEQARLFGADFTSLIIFLSALLPAIGAALYGIRTQGDFCALAGRSQLIVEQLGRLDRAIRRDPLDYRRLTERLRRLSAIMLAEVDQWRQSSERRPVELPG